MARRARSGPRDERPARSSWRGHGSSLRGRVRWGVHRAHARVRRGALRARGAERVRSPRGRREAYASAPCGGGRRRASGDAGSRRRGGAARRQAVLRVHAPRHGRGRVRRAPRRVRRPPGRAAGRTGDATRRSERAAPARGDAWRRRGRRRDVQQERQEVRARREKIVRLLPIPRACTPGPSRGAPPPSSTGLAMPHGDRVKKQKTTSRVHLPGFFRVFFAAISFGSF